MLLKLKSIIAAIVLSALLAGCNVGSATIGEQIDPGHVALLVNNYGDANEKGFANAKLIRGGRVNYNSFSQILVEAPTYFTRAEYSAGEQATVKQPLTFSLRGVPVTMGMAITYRFKDAPVDPAKDPEFTHFHAFFMKYRQDPKDFAHGMLLNSLRDASQRTNMSAVEALSDTEGFVTKVKEVLTADYPDLEFQTVSIVGSPQVPEDTQKAANATAAAQQNAQAATYRKQQAEAEATANVATAKGEAQVRVINAQAQADANKLLTSSITPDLLKLKELEVQRARWEKWDGKLAPTIQAPNVQANATN